MAPDQKRYQVGIFGSYGFWNHGDEGILDSIITQLRRSLPVDITVFSQDAAVTNRLHQVERAVPLAKMTRAELLPELQRLDLLIVGGGGILFDHWVQAHGGVETLAVETGLPVMIYAAGAGPLDDPQIQKQVAGLIQAARLVTVRDLASKQILEKAGASREMIITADPALLLEPEPVPEGLWQREGIDPNAPLVGISLREPGPAAPGMEVDQYLALVASAADFVVERFGANLVFIPMEPKTQDIQHSHAAIARMRRPERAAVLQGEYTPRQILGLMGQLKFAIGMRLHFLIFAAVQNVPFVALPYASKVSGFIESIGLEMPPLQDITTGQFLAYVDQVWDTASDFRVQIAAGIPPLQAKARETNRLAVELLKTMG